MRREAINAVSIVRVDPLAGQGLALIKRKALRN